MERPGGRPGACYVDAVDELPRTGPDGDRPGPPDTRGTRGATRVLYRSTVPGPVWAPVAAVAVAVLALGLAWVCVQRHLPAGTALCLLLAVAAVPVHRAVFPVVLEVRPDVVVVNPGAFRLTRVVPLSSLRRVRPADRPGRTGAWSPAARTWVYEAGPARPHGRVTFSEDGGRTTTVSVADAATVTAVVERARVRFRRSPGH
ncbi:hypothetical protein CXF30_04945 [Corynebacterium bovis]|nr:hypothetical protein CXF30_04945 [Corynebacterium bovis]